MDGFCPRPPRRDNLVMSEGLDANPIGAGGNGMAGLLGGVEEFFDPAMIAGIAPGFQQATDAMQLKHMLKRQCNIRSKDAMEGDSKDGVPGHKPTRSM